MLVAGLSSASTPEEAATAYRALAEASLALHTATNLPENEIARLQGELQSVQDTLSETQRVTAAVVAATTAVAGLDNDSLEADVDAARTVIDAAKTALTGAMNVSDADKASLQAATRQSRDVRCLPSKWRWQPGRLRNRDQRGHAEDHRTLLPR